jgi:hypothetical protein
VFAIETFLLRNRLGALERNVESASSLSLAPEGEHRTEGTEDTVWGEAMMVRSAVLCRIDFQPVSLSTARYFRKKRSPQPMKRTEDRKDHKGTERSRDDAPWKGTQARSLCYFMRHSAVAAVRGNAARWASALVLVPLPAALSLRIKALVPSDSAECVERRRY